MFSFFKCWFLFWWCFWCFCSPRYSLSWVPLCISRFVNPCSPVRFSTSLGVLVPLYFFLLCLVLVSLLVFTPPFYSIFVVSSPLPCSKLFFCLCSLCVVPHAWFLDSCLNFKFYYLACLSILGLGSSPSCVLISLIVHSPNVMLFSFNHTILLCPSLVIKTMIEAGLTAQDFESMQLPFPGYLFIYCSKKKFMLFFHLFVLVMTW